MTIVFGHRIATSADVRILARMNQQVIEDERRRNPMDLTDLETRMRFLLRRNDAAVWARFQLERNHA